MTPRLQSKEVREVAALITSLGYQYDRADGSHLVYRHESQAPLVLAGSPSDHRWRANMLAELRRRHPDAAILRENVRTRPVDERRRRRGRNGTTAAALTAAVEAAQRTAAEVTSVALRVPEDHPTCPACLECRRPWLSDLDYGTRPCPACGGPIVRRAA